VRRRLATSNYNSRPEECRQATKILKTHLPHIKTLRDVSSADLAHYGHHLPEILRRRVRHVVDECQRVQAGVAALQASDLQQFGQLIRQSQSSSRDNYESSIPELDTLAAAAWDVSGCFGSRFGGGGYGGIMQVLVEKTAVSAVQSAMSHAFEKAYGRIPPMLVTSISDGASVIFS
jgi:galactokinase